MAATDSAPQRLASHSASPATKQFRSLGFEVEELKAGEDGWQFSGHAAAFSNVDYGGDVLLPGAFADTLKSGNFRPLLWQHDMREPIGVEKRLVEDGKGLYGTWELVDTQRGTDAYKLLKKGALRSMSIGYVPVDAEYDGDVRVLKSVDLLENSLVSLGMNPQALVTAVKAADLATLAQAVALALEEKAVWDTAYVNTLEDNCFAGVEPGGTKDGEGKTVPRDLRHLPHHAKGNGGDGPVDLPHLRNALSRVEQMDAGGAAFRDKCRAHLERHARAEGIGMAGDGGSSGKTADLSGMTYGDHAAAVSAALAAFVARTGALLDDLTAKGLPATGAKQRQVADLLATFAGLEPLRVRLWQHAAALAPIGTAAPAVPDAGTAAPTVPAKRLPPDLAHMRLRLEMRRRKDRLVALSATVAPAPTPAPDLAPVEMAGPNDPTDDTRSPGDGSGAASPGTD